MGKPVVISLGGSLIVPDRGPDHQFLKSFKDIILKLVDEGRRFLIVAGGGSVTRIYQEAAKKIVRLPDEDLDWLGIHVTRLNAQLLRAIFREKAHLKVLTHYTEREEIPERVAIGAGWKPGHSTDYDAVSFAKLYECDTVINLSDISYVYERDPDKFPDAKPLKELGWGDFRKIVGDTWIPGDKLPFDPIASKLAHESGIKVVLMNGKNLPNFENYLLGKPFEGTVIS